MRASGRCGRSSASTRALPCAGRPAGPASRPAAACSRPDSRQPTAALPPPSSPSSWRIRQPWETRDPKHEPRSLDEQRSTWARQAREVLGSDQAVHALVRHALAPQVAHGHRVDAAWMHATAPARPQPRPGPPAALGTTSQARPTHPRPPPTRISSTCPHPGHPRQSTEIPNPRPRPPTRHPPTPTNPSPSSQEGRIARFNRKLRISESSARGGRTAP